MYLSAWWNDVADVTQIAGLLLALVLAWMAWYQLRLARDELSSTQSQLVAGAVAAESQTVLALDEAFAQFQDLRNKLREAEKSGTVYAPTDLTDRARLSRYLVVFERLGLLVKKGLIDPQLARQLYGYALSRILVWSNAQSILREEVHLHHGGAPDEKRWENLIRLWDDLLDEPSVPDDLLQALRVD
jgi:hypothetical protein